MHFSSKSLAHFSYQGVCTLGSYLGSVSCANISYPSSLLQLRKALLLGSFTLAPVAFQGSGSEKFKGQLFKTILCPLGIMASLERMFTVSSNEVRSIKFSTNLTL